MNARQIRIEVKGKAPIVGNYFELAWMALTRSGDFENICGGRDWGIFARVRKFLTGRETWTIYYTA